jgi:hypothetical protein
MTPSLVRRIARLLGPGGPRRLAVGASFLCVHGISLLARLEAEADRRADVDGPIVGKA